MAVVVTVAKGYDLGYIWKTQGEAAGRAAGGYYLNAAQAGEPPGRWWGPGAQALGLTPRQIVQRKPYEAVYQQVDPRTGGKLGRSRGRYATFADHLARLTAAEPHATAERLIELEREAAQATRQPAVYIDVTVSFSKSISVLHASLYSRPGAARYATAAQLTLEEQLVAHAQAQGAPRLLSEVAARRLGADVALLEAELRGRAPDARAPDAPRRLRLDQAAAIWHALTSARTVEIITGPAGTGKTRVLATAASIWDGPVFGTATSQNATNELCGAGVQVAANTTRLLADLTEGRIPPGSLIVADEGSMVSATHLAALTEYAARNRCKLVLAGDQEQLAAVEGGGAMMLLADRLGYVQLAEPVRFTAGWERGASLRLRAGDATALDEYHQHGRIRGAPPDQAVDQAVRAYVASYLDGRDVLLMAADWARCRELSARIRDDLIHLGLVDNGRTIRIADGAEASVGDLIICRRNDHAVEAGAPGRALANGDVLRIEAITPGGIIVRRRLDPDRATGQRRFTDRAFRYPGYQSADLAYAITGPPGPARRPDRSRLGHHRPRPSTR